MIKKIIVPLAVIVVVILVYAVVLSYNSPKLGVFEVRLENTSDYNLGQGVLVIHGGGESFNYLGRKSDALSDLSDGDLSTFINEFKGSVDEIIPTIQMSTGQRTVYEIEGDSLDSAVSLFIPIEGEDSIAWISVQKLFAEDGRPKQNRINAQIITVAGETIDHSSLHNQTILLFEIVNIE